MTEDYGYLDDEIRCNAEITRIESGPADGAAYLPALGHADWNAEKFLIEQEHAALDQRAASELSAVSVLVSSIGNADMKNEITLPRTARNETKDNDPGKPDRTLPVGDTGGIGSDYPAEEKAPEPDRGHRAGEDGDDQVVVAPAVAPDYHSFLIDKSQTDGRGGFSPIWMPPAMFDFQQSLAEWSISKGRAAIFADCGLGKTLIQLTWAENVVRKTNRPVLVLTPLAVGAQTIREGEKFGIQCRKSDGTAHPGINISNYERLHHFNPDDFAGVVCDESSILKSFTGKRRGEITEFMRTRQYRLLCTATAAPNDYVELGTSSEALGELGYTDMLTRFFKNDQNTVKPMRYTGFGNPRGAPEEKDRTDKWRFKGHAEIPFWRYVCSWARAVRKPSDIGFSDEKFILPPLIEQQHLVTAQTLAPGMLFAMPAVGLKEQREERRRTIKERCEKIASLVETGDPALIWCHLNDEGDLLEKIIPDCSQVSGKDSDEEKEEKFLAFTSGQLRVLATKEKIGAWGLNFQHCNHVLSFPSHSFEGYYQGIRRVYRFGQKRKVTVDTVTTEGEQSVLENRQKKAAAADKMFSRLVECMNSAIRIERGNKFTESEEIPEWL